MKERYDYSRHNRVDRLIIEAQRKLKRKQAEEAQRKAASRAKGKSERKIRRQRLIRELQGEIPEALTRLEEQDWPGSELVIAGILKHKWSWNKRQWDTYKAPVLTDKTERAAWEVARYHSSGSGDSDSKGTPLRIEYWLLSTGEIGVSGTTTDASYNSHLFIPFHRADRSHQAFPHVEIIDPGSVMDDPNRRDLVGRTMLESTIAGVQDLGR